MTVSTIPPDGQVGNPSVPDGVNPGTGLPRSGILTVSDPLKRTNVVLVVSGPFDDPGTTTQRKSSDTVLLNGFYSGTDTRSTNDQLNKRSIRTFIDSSLWFPRLYLVWLILDYLTRQVSRYPYLLRMRTLNKFTRKRDGGLKDNTKDKELKQEW